MLEFLVYTVWACLKGMTLYEKLKEESTNKNHYNVNYSYIAPASLKYSPSITPEIFLGLFSTTNLKHFPMEPVNIPSCTLNIKS